jgi:hypothetical protein
MKTNFLLLLTLILIVAVSLGLVKSRSKPTGLGVYPEIVTFAATPEVVRAGEPVTLTWETRGTVSVAMEWGPPTPAAEALQLRPNLPSSGSITVQPTEDTVYELRCYTVAGPMCLPISATVKVK